ncbi:hypothetical protein EH31_01570 [Erythrobacter longus]|uniref:HTH marR-type domain-containing protein n=1 Tax=Erythrobacter longus TaxID=1044 RepID=A0A074MHN3_ERYLO|nr:hypothetical protein [Erythrobacter longus]KEO91378.1 hypothetical protein EH31_01570 [Erythrobacter longus]
MKIAFGDTSKGWTDRLGDPVVAQAERLFAYRQERIQLIDPELLGEPGWDILLYAFITAGSSRVCRPEALAKELRLSSDAIRNWIERLAERDLLQDCGATTRITPHGEAIMRRLLNAHLKDMARELGAGDGLIQFSSGSVPEGE